MSRARRRSTLGPALAIGIAGGGAALGLALVAPKRPVATRVVPQRGPSSPGTSSLPAEVAPVAPLASLTETRVVLPRDFGVRALRRKVTLSDARGWAQSNEAWYRLRDTVPPARQLALLDRTWREASEPVARQNLIFLVALTQPWEAARPWLRLRLEGEPADARDARWALAMSGEEDALRALAGAPAPADPAPVLVDELLEHEAIGLRGGAEARARLLPYRALEVVDRAPYFKKTSLEVHVRWRPHPLAERGSSQGGVWIDPDRTAPPRLLPRLWTRWVRGFPGHPGSDDVALRIGRALLRQRSYLPAARWFSEASVLPDQDVTWGALANLLSTAELLLGEAALEQLVEEARGAGRNHRLLQYVLVRRMAATRGCAQALEAAREIARGAPDSELGLAWRLRWSQAPPRGLESGVAPLRGDDPLLRRVARPRARPLATTSLPAGVPVAGDFPGQARRLRPAPDAIRFDVERLARQLRLWETIAELERRERAGGPSAADHRYKRAALFFHQPDALFPAYTAYRRNAETSVDRIWEVSPEDEPSYQRALRAFASRANGHARASALLSGIERDHPDYAGLPDALFTRGLCYERLLARPWCDDELAAVRGLVEAFETLLGTCPTSTLCDDAQRAVAYWRWYRPDAFNER